MPQHRRRGESLLQFFKGIVALLGPLVLVVFLQKAVEWACDDRKVLDETSVIGAESEKPLKFLDVARLGKLPYGFDCAFCRSYTEAADSMSKSGKLLVCDVAFGW